MSKAFDTRMAEWRDQIDRCLSQIIDFSDYSDEFKEVLRYAVFPGGKRLRPILFLEWHCMKAFPDDDALRFACGLELLHCYSLIHDDMPCMDNDDIRRGKPSVHKAFGEGKALLAGDALQALAFRAMHADGAKSVWSYSAMVDAESMLQGQYLDLYGRINSIEDLFFMYRKKTGALIEGACKLGYFFAHDEFSFADKARSELFYSIAHLPLFDGTDVFSADTACIHFGRALGIAFQIYDDVTEYIAGEKHEGKSVLDFVDLDEAKRILNKYLNDALAVFKVEYDDGQRFDGTYLGELVEKLVVL